jgi:hypothetical protein
MPPSLTGHPGRGSKTSHALTFTPDHPMGAGQSGPSSSSSSASLQGALQTLGITHIFPRRINALAAFPARSVLLC